MNTARIVVLAIAVGAGGIAAYPASGPDKPPPAAPAAQLPTVDVLVAKYGIGVGQSVKPEDLQWQTWPAATASSTPALRSIANVNAPEIKTDARTPRRGESVNVVRYGVNSPTTTQK